MSKSERKDRTNFIRMPQLKKLEHALLIVCKGLDEHCCYLVGSAGVRSDYNDVDIRVIMDDAKYERLFARREHAGISPFWSLFCTSVSVYLTETTGLPIDFQVQSMTIAARHSGKFREPIALYPNGKFPTWLQDEPT